MESIDVIVVGGGMAGLAAALKIQRAGARVLVLEASDRPGGRIRTDEVDGFLLDRGFQVYLDAYPDGRALLDYEALDLRSFSPGALIWDGEDFHRIADPWRQPKATMETLRSPVGTMGDKFKVAKLRAEVSRGADPQRLLEGPDDTTLQDLRQEGFSEGFIQTFFRPFYGGIFLERNLETTSRLFRYTFRMFANGNATVPAHGMEEIPRQVAAALGPEAVRTEAPVRAVSASGVELESGESLEAGAVILATDAVAAAYLLGEPPTPTRSVGCVYFDAPVDPIGEPTLVLNGTGRGPVNNLASMTQVSPFYAPEGRTLLAASVVGKELPEVGAPGLEGAVREQLAQWYGESAVREWRHLATYIVEHALPAQPPGVLDPPSRTAFHASGVIVAGDHRETASTQGAIRSGRAAAALALDLVRG